MQRGGAVYENQGSDLHGRLQMSEQVRRQLTERMRDILKRMKWVEPMTRPKGKAYEEVLIAAVEEQLSSLKAKFEDSSRMSERARTAMMDALGKLEDDVVENEHEISKVKEDRDKLLRVLLETQERVAREILLRKEEMVRTAAQQSALAGQCKQREQLIDSLMKQRQELQLRLGRMGDMEREIENARAKVEAAGEERDMLSKRCDSLGEKTRSLEQKLEAAEGEGARQRARAVRLHVARVRA